MSDKKHEPIETTKMTVQQPRDAAVIDPTTQTERSLELFEERVRVARKQIAVAMKLTTPSQWVVMDGGNGRETVYATAGAADRILRMGFGMKWGKWSFEIKRSEKETVCHATADLMQQDGTLYEAYTGRRAMGGFVRNERDLMKGAVQNAKHTAVTDIMGLRFLSKADFKELGLDLDQLERRVEFQDHGDGGKQGSQFIAPFGRGKGKPITELDDGDLEWLAKAVKKSVEDPAKAKWRTKNEALYQACRDEWSRRHKPAQDDKPAEVPSEEPSAEETSPQENWDEVGPPPMEDHEPGSDG